MFGQAFHFLNKSGEPDAYGQMRYVAESRRLVWVLEVGLDGKDYLAGDRITLADMATIGWVAMCPLLGIDLTEFPNTLVIICYCFMFIVGVYLLAYGNCWKNTTL